MAKAVFFTMVFAVMTWAGASAAMSAAANVQAHQAQILSMAD